MYSFIEILAACITSLFVICFIAYLVYHAGRPGDHVVTMPKMMGMPRLIPWTIASRARRARAETEFEKARTELFEAKHARLQKELVYIDLEDRRLQEALERGLPSGPVPVEKPDVSETDNTIDNARLAFESEVEYAAR